jgi:hypothetical protein
MFWTAFETIHILVVFIQQFQKHKTIQIIKDVNFIGSTKWTNGKKTVVPRLVLNIWVENHVYISLNHLFVKVKTSTH